MSEELAVILVHCHHVDFESRFRFRCGKGAYYIVGFIARFHHYRDAHGPAYFCQRVERVYDKLRGGASGAFVFVEKFVAESFSRRVECDGKVCRLLFRDQFEYVFRHPEQDGSVGSFGVYHRFS